MYRTNRSGLCVTPNKTWIDSGREKIFFQSKNSVMWKFWVLPNWDWGLRGRTLWLSYYTSRVQFRFSVWMNGSLASRSKGAIWYEIQGLEGSRCKMKCINLFCSHTRSVANSLWKGSQVGLKVMNYWSIPIIHSYIYLVVTLSHSLSHRSIDYGDLKAYKTSQI